MGLVRFAFCLLDCSYYLPLTLNQLSSRSALPRRRAGLARASVSPQLRGAGGEEAPLDGADGASLLSY